MSVRKPSNYLWAIDCGHGGIKNGKYVTAPDKMFKFPDGTVVYEGVINRAIGKLVYEKLKALNIDFKIVSDEVEDTPLSVRVARTNNIYRKDKRTILLSIHSNAGGGQGLEIFTSPGQTPSDPVAQIFCETYKKELPWFKFRSGLGDGDLDKEEKFYVLVNTIGPALLVENLFFDNQAEAAFLLSDEGQKKIADCIVRCIQEVESQKPI